VGTASGAHSILAHAAEPVLAALRASAPDSNDPGHPGYPATADTLARALRDGTLSSHLTPKALGALAAELLDSLPGSPAGAAGDLGSSTGPGGPTPEPGDHAD